MSLRVFTGFHEITGTVMKLVDEQDIPPYSVTCIVAKIKNFNAYAKPLGFG